MDVPPVCRGSEGKGLNHVVPGKAYMRAPGEWRLYAVTVGIAVVAGIVIGLNTVPGQERAPAMDESIRAPNATGRLFNVTFTVNQTEEWRAGKTEPGTTRIMDGTLELSDGAPRMRYYESVTVRFTEIERVVVQADIPEGTAATLRVITSGDARFQRNGSYYREAVQRFPLVDGRNVLEPRTFDEQFYRVHVSLERTSETAPSPGIDWMEVRGISVYEEAVTYPYPR